MIRLIFVRHGETGTNVKNVLHQVNDPDKLTERGIKQIQNTAEKLQKLGIKKLYTSNEARAIQSAEIIGDICGLEVNILGGMEERNWGDFQGKPWAGIQSVLDPMTLEERYNFVPPNGESWKMFEERLIRSVKSILSTPENVEVIVTHGGSIRAIMPYLLNVPKEESFKYDFKNGSISIFDFDNEKFHKIHVNNVEHLEGLI